MLNLLVGERKTTVPLCISGQRRTLMVSVIGTRLTSWWLGPGAVNSPCAMIIPWDC